MCAIILTWVVGSGLKQLGHGVDHLPPYSAKVRISGYIPLLHLYAFSGVDRYNYIV